MQTVKGVSRQQRPAWRMCMIEQTSRRCSLEQKCCWWAVGLECQSLKQSSSLNVFVCIIGEGFQTLMFLMTKHRRNHNSQEYKKEARKTQKRRAKKGILYLYTVVASQPHYAAILGMTATVLKHPQKACSSHLLWPNSAIICNYFHG